MKFQSILGLWRYKAFWLWLIFGEFANFFSGIWDTFSKYLNRDMEDQGPPTWASDTDQYELAHTVGLKHTHTHINPFFGFL